MPTWAVQQITRLGGLVEDICEHGVGHPNKEYLKQHKQQGCGIHGCDGCCNGSKQHQHTQPLHNRTIKTIDKEASNCWRIDFTDGTHIFLWAEISGPWEVPELFISDES